MLFGLSNGQSEAMVVIEQEKIFEKDNVTIYVPQIKDIKDRKTKENLNNLLVDYAKFGLEIYKNFVEEA